MRTTENQAKRIRAQKKYGQQAYVLPLLVLSHNTIIPPGKFLGYLLQ